MFHPNVYADGGICLDILQNRWSPTYDVSAILTSIQSLLDEPNPNSPANSVAAQLYQVPANYSPCKGWYWILCRKIDENMRSGSRLWWNRAGWYSPRRQMERRMGASLRPRSEEAWYWEPRSDELQTSGVRRRGKSEPVKILIKYSML